MNTIYKNSVAFAIRVTSHLTANSPSQSALRLGVTILQYLRGLGSGSSNLLSGQQHFLRTLSPNCVVVDVGANVGQFAKQVLTSCESAQLHCFEPSSASFAMLEKHVGPRARLNQCAVSATPGTAVLYSPQCGSELASLTKRSLDHIGLTVQNEEIVRVTTLTEYCSEKGLSHIDLLKIDAEGHEMGVLEGCKQLFEQRRVRTVLFEFGGANIDTRTFFRDFYTFFRQMGAKSISRLSPSGAPLVVHRYSEELEYFRTTNYLVMFDS